MPRYVLLGAVALVLCLPAWASKKDDDYKAAQAAAAAGQYENAMKLYCAVAKEDANYKDAKQNCENIRTELLKDHANRSRYLTLDYWTSVAEYDAFRSAYAAQFRDIDAKGETLTERESLIGSFEAAWDRVA